MKDVRIEGNVVRTAKQQLATMCNVMKCLNSHEHPEKTCKHRIECNCKKNGRN